ncbi:hypothetical protein [Nocardiopsis lucentensis]|uniref:hypothetical protein n=1 Tax=Nocardiopsis lucentensis TaxID=53441 RepID=UPI000346F5A8|nr:hypothetical protein [Nocardiopsis lucentensis]
MAYSIPALLRPTLEILRALLTPARGRHSAAAARRRRSTRVRRYAPMPAPEQAAAPVPAPRTIPEGDLLAPDHPSFAARTRTAVAV